MTLGSIVTPVLEVFGVWTASTFLFAGIGGAVALINRRSGSEVGAEAARGAAAGFIIGIPWVIATILLLAFTS
jgi:hypothetical protein